MLKAIRGSWGHHLGSISGVLDLIGNLWWAGKPAVLHRAIWKFPTHFLYSKFYGLLKLIFHTNQHNDPNRTAVFPQGTIPDLIQMSPDRLILRKRCNSQSIILSDNTYFLYIFVFDLIFSCIEVHGCPPAQIRILLKTAFLLKIGRICVCHLLIDQNFWFFCQK